MFAIISFSVFEASFFDNPVISFKSRLFCSHLILYFFSKILQELSDSTKLYCEEFDGTSPTIPLG